MSSLLPGYTKTLSIQKHFNDLYNGKSQLAQVLEWNQSPALGCWEVEGWTESLENDWQSHSLIWRAESFSFKK